MTAVTTATATSHLGSMASARGAGEQGLLAGQRLARRGRDRHRDDLARRGQAVEVDDLVVGRAAADAAGVVAVGALHEHVERAADEPLRTLPRPPLDDPDEPLHALDAHLVREEVLREPGRLGASAGRVDEGEGAVEADLLGDLE